MNNNLIMFANDQVLVFEHGTASTLMGAKESNEDSVTVRIEERLKRICVADGHWGVDAAHQSALFWSKLASFPTDRESALSATRDLENTFLAAFGRDDMNEDEDFTPESAFIAVDLINSNMRFVSYGDCRLLVVRNKKIIIRNQPEQTWIGAFSSLGLRNRLPIDKVLEFKHHELNSGDIILIFSDGVDECVYGVATLTDEFLEQATTSGDLLAIHKTIIDAVVRHGAEDNASLVVLRIA